MVVTVVNRKFRLELSGGTHPCQGGGAGEALNFIESVYEYKHNPDCSVTGVKFIAEKPYPNFMVSIDIIKSI